MLLLKTREIQNITINCIPETSVHPMHKGVPYIDLHHFVHKIGVKHCVTGRGLFLFWLMLDLCC